MHNTAKKCFAIRNGDGFRDRVPRDGECAGVSVDGELLAIDYDLEIEQKW